MSRPDAPDRRPSPRGWSDDGSWTSPSGTPFAVPVSRDRRALLTAVTLLAGPVLWSVHFLVVYLVAEAGCTGDGPGLDLFDPPVPKVVTLAATAVAAAGTLVCTAWAYRRWQANRAEAAARDAGEREAGARAGTAQEAGDPEDGTAAGTGEGTGEGTGQEVERRGDIDDRDRGGALLLAGAMLSLLAFVMVLFVGLPALVLPSC
jgi:hypothetical protein